MQERRSQSRESRRTEDERRLAGAADLGARAAAAGPRAIPGGGRREELLCGAARQAEAARAGGAG